MIVIERFVLIFKHFHTSFRKKVVSLSPIKRMRMVQEYCWLFIIYDKNCWAKALWQGKWWSRLFYFPICKSISSQLLDCGWISDPITLQKWRQTTSAIPNFILKIFTHLEFIFSKQTLQIRINFHVRQLYHQRCAVIISWNNITRWEYNNYWFTFFNLRHRTGVVVSIFVTGAHPFLRRFL